MSAIRALNSGWLRALEAASLELDLGRYSDSIMESEFRQYASQTSACPSFEWPESRILPRDSDVIGTLGATVSSWLARQPPAQHHSHVSHSVPVKTNQHLHTPIPILITLEPVGAGGSRASFSKDPSRILIPFVCSRLLETARAPSCEHLSWCLSVCLPA